MSFTIEAPSTIPISNSIASPSILFVLQSNLPMYGRDTMKPTSSSVWSSRSVLLKLLKTKKTRRCKGCAKILQEKSSNWRATSSCCFDPIPSINILFFLLFRRSFFHQERYSTRWLQSKWRFSSMKPLLFVLYVFFFLSTIWKYKLIGF